MHMHIQRTNMHSRWGWGDGVRCILNRVFSQINANWCGSKIYIAAHTIDHCSYIHVHFLVNVSPQEKSNVFHRIFENGSINYRSSWPKIKKPVHPGKKPANEQVQRQLLKTSKKPVMYQWEVWPISITYQDNKVLWYCDLVYMTTTKHGIKLR